MKQLLLILSFVFCFAYSFSQPISNRSSTAITVQDGNLFALNSFRPACFADTTSANLVTSLDSCGKMIFTYDINGYWLRACSPKRWIRALAANNGLSIGSNNVQLGGPLIKNTTITGIDSTLTLSNGTFLVSVDHRVNGAVPPFKVRSTSALFHEMAEFKADNTTEVWLRTDSLAGFASTLYSTGGVLGMTIGKDGVAAHNFIQIKDGNPLWIENAASLAFAAFEDDGDIGLVVGGTSERLGIGVTAPQYRVDINNTKTGLTAIDRVFNLNDNGTTYNTSGGALTNYLAFLSTAATRSTGGNDLTNIGLNVSASGAQVNQAIVVPTGDVVFGVVSDADTYNNMAHAQTVNNGSSTQRHGEVQITRSMVFNDTLSGTENFSAALRVASRFRAKQSYQIADNLKGSAIESQLNLLRNTAYTGAVTYRGADVPTNNVTTMPSVIVARMNMSTVQSGANSITATGWWAAYSGVFDMNTGNRIHNAVWFNAGAGQMSGAAGTIDTAYGLYVNTFPSLVGVKYAIKQTGAADSNSFAGPVRHLNLSTGISSDSVLVTNNGVVKRVLQSSIGSMAIGASITSATEGSVLFAGAAGVLAQDNAAFNYTDANNALYVDSVRTLRLQSPVVVGGTAATDDLILRTTTGTGAAGADMIFQGGTNGSVEFARFLNAGNFGVGVTNPTSRIHSGGDIKSNGTVIWGSAANGTLTYSGSDAYIDASISGGALFFRTNATATTVMKMLPSTGRVLIGSTTDLGRKVQITGSAYITDSLLLGNLPAGAVTDSIVVINANVVKKLSTTVPRSPLYNPQSGTTYTVLSTDASTIIGLSNSAARTITLAAASAYPAGTIIWFKDEAGTAGTGNITINRAGADTIDGATSAVIATNYGLIGIYTNGSNAWFIW